MLLELVGKNIELTEAMKVSAEDKFAKLDKFFDEQVRARAVFSTEKNNQTAEVTIFLPGTIVRAEETTPDLYASMDKAVSVLERQISKHKAKLRKRYQDSSDTIRFDNIENTSEESIEDEAPKVVKRKNFQLKPMFEEEAILQMDLLNHNFFIYLNAENENVEVLYKRDDGNYGIIDVEVL